LFLLFAVYVQRKRNMCASYVDVQRGHDNELVNEDDARLADAIRYAAERELWEPELEIAIVYDGEANGPMIAAVPELLAEAKQLLRNAKFQDGQGTILTQDAEALEAAIARAEGGAQ
jgi:hypothetical protein